jgi:hypothetical protein
MSLALVTTSHSPLLGFNEAPAEAEKALQSAFSQARSFVADYDPELVVVFELPAQRRPFVFLHPSGVPDAPRQRDQPMSSLPRIAGRQPPPRARVL